MGPQDGFHHCSVEGDRHKDRVVDIRDRPVLIAQHMTETNQPVVLFVRGQSWAQRQHHDLLKSEVDDKAPSPIAEGKDVSIRDSRASGKDEAQVLTGRGLETKPTLLRLSLVNGHFFQLLSLLPLRDPSGKVGILMDIPETMTDA